VADHIYEAGLQKVTTAAAVAIASIVPATLASGTRMPEVREIGIFNVSGVAAEVGIGYPAALGTGGVTTTETVQALNPTDPAGHTALVTVYTTLQPTAPTNYMRRFELQPVIGAGVIFTWNPGEFALWAGATINAPVIFQISTAIVTYDISVKVAE
jgi:hypothetical protein